MQPCVVVSLASTSLALSDLTTPQLCPLQLLLPLLCTVSASAAVPRLCPLQLLLPNCVCFSCQLLLPDCVLFSCCSSSTSACYHAHAVQNTISTKVACRYCSPAPPNFPLPLCTDKHLNLNVLISLSYIVLQVTSGSYFVHSSCVMHYFKNNSSNRVEDTMNSHRDGWKAL